MNRFTLVMISLILITPLNVSGAGPMHIDFDTQRAGGDYTNFYVNTYEECARQCEAASRCIAFDYHTDHSCWLKSHAYAPRYYRGAVSGIKRFPRPHAAAPSGDDSYGLVLSAQRILADLGYRPGSMDGRMGHRTRAALRTYQYDNGLKPTGELDPPTLMAMGLIVKPKNAAPEQQQQQPPQVEPENQDVESPDSPKG